MASVRKKVDAPNGLVQPTDESGPGSKDLPDGLQLAGRPEVLEDAAQGSPAKAALRCQVDGRPVSSMYLQINGKPAFLITEDSGTTEITRVYYSPSQYGTKPLVFKCGWADDRIGQANVESASYETEKGLQLKLSRGQTMFIHTSQLSGNWAWAD